MPKSKSYTKKELEEYKELLLKRRAEILSDMSRMEDEALGKTRDDASTQDISDFADLGTENFEQELTLGLIESEQEELQQIQASLERITQGTYGRCEQEGCKSGLIPKARLKAVPYTDRCIECQKLLEQEGNL